PTSFFFLSASPAALPPLPSFPTRRSSDLALLRRHLLSPAQHAWPSRLSLAAPAHSIALGIPPRRYRQLRSAAPRPTRTNGRRRRSEEHTSELQSLPNLVCRLLLEKNSTHISNTDRLAQISLRRTRYQTARTTVSRSSPTTVPTPYTRSHHAGHRAHTTAMQDNYKA